MRINHDDLDYTDELIFEWQEKPFTGIAYELEDDTLQSEISYIDGVQQGITREWYLSGQLKIECLYKNGSLHGYYREWFKNDQMKTDRLYELAVLVRKKDWDVNGVLLEDFEIDEQHQQYSLLEKLRHAYKDKPEWQ